MIHRIGGNRNCCIHFSHGVFVPVLATSAGFVFSIGADAVPVLSALSFSAHAVKVKVDAIINEKKNLDVITSSLSQRKIQNSAVC